MASKLFPLFLLVILSGCSIQKATFPLPPVHMEQLEKTPYKFEILSTQGNYFFVNSMVNDTLFLDYQTEELGIKDGIYPEWKLSNSYVTPFSNETIYFDSYAVYSEEFEYDEVKTEIFTQRNELLGTITGFPQNPLLDYEENELMIRVVDSWASGSEKVELQDSVYRHYFPFGGEINVYQDNRDNIIAKVIQGGILGESQDVNDILGISYSVIFPYEPTLESFEKTITILMAYFSFSDMHFYYNECDYMEPLPDGSCPSLIVIEQ